jgi:hypothetical protein
MSKTDDTRTTPATSSSNHLHGRQMQELARATILPIDVLLNRGVIQTISRTGPETWIRRILLANILRNFTMSQRLREPAVSEILLTTMVFEMYQQDQDSRKGTSMQIPHQDRSMGIPSHGLYPGKKAISSQGLHASSYRCDIFPTCPVWLSIFTGCSAQNLCRRAW